MRLKLDEARGAVHVVHLRVLAEAVVQGDDAARDGHRFADLQWRWTCANRSWITRVTGSVAAFTWSRGATSDRCPGDSALPAPAVGAGATTVIAAGRLDTTPLSGMMRRGK